MKIASPFEPGLAIATKLLAVLPRTLYLCISGLVKLSPPSTDSAYPM